MNGLDVPECSQDGNLPRAGAGRPDDEALANEPREEQENGEIPEEASLSVSVVEDDAEGEPPKLKKADEAFAEKRVMPPIRLLIMILLTASQLLPLVLPICLTRGRPDVFIWANAKCKVKLIKSAALQSWRCPTM